MRSIALIMMMLLLTACGTTAEPEVFTPTAVQVQRLNSDAAVGRSRLSFALLDGPEPLTGVAAVTLALQPLDAEDESPLWTGTAANYSDYEIPYWVAYPEVETAGFYGVTLMIAMADGRSQEAQFVLDVAASSKSVTIGSAAPPSQNRTLATEPDINLLSSGNDPDPMLYQQTVAAAVTSGRPTVVGFLTPGLCQTRWCAPVLDSVMAVRDEVGAAANFIHIEVFADFQQLNYVPEMAEWGLETEPWVFVLDNGGRVAAKFEGPLSPRELGAALEPLLP